MPVHSHTVTCTCGLLAAGRAIGTCRAGGHRSQQLQWASGEAPVGHPSGSGVAWFGQRDNLIRLLGGNDQRLPAEGCNLVQATLQPPRLASGYAVTQAAHTLSSGMPGAFSTSAASGQAARSTEPSSSPSGTMATSTSASLRVRKQCATLGSS